MKTTEELNALREEVETLNKKFQELSEEELKQVVGGVSNPLYIKQGVLITATNLLSMMGKNLG